MNSFSTWTLICVAVCHPLIAQSSFDGAMVRQLESDVADLMARSQVPGASVAIVQHGQIVYTQGFGVREKGKPGRVTPESLMMIGSTGKSMTTMMMAALVVAWRRGIESALANQSDEVAPYKILPAALDSVKTVVHDRIRLFCSGSPPVGLIA